MFGQQYDGPQAKSSPYIDGVIAGDIPKPTINEVFDMATEMRRGIYTGIATEEDLVAMAWALGATDVIRLMGA